jgi:hypothetical protein
MYEWPVEVVKHDKWMHPSTLPIYPVCIYTNENYDRDFRTVIVKDKYIDIRAQTYSKGEEEEVPDIDGEENKEDPLLFAKIYSKPVLHLKWSQFERYFPGSDANQRWHRSEDSFATQLIHIKDTTYVHVAGTGVRQFTLPDNDFIVDYYTNLRNNDVPYPFAIGKKYIYVFGMIMPTKSVSADRPMLNSCVAMYYPVECMTKEYIAGIRSDIVSRKLATAKEMENRFIAAELPESVEEFEERSRTYPKNHVDRSFDPLMFLGFTGARLMRERKEYLHHCEVLADRLTGFLPAQHRFSNGKKVHRRQNPHILPHELGFVKEMGKSVPSLTN